MTEKSYIQYNAEGQATSFVGDQAVDVFRAAVIRSAIGLYLKTGMKANRAYTPTNMLRAAGNITGKKYVRGRAGLQAAQEDLTRWVNAAKAALPVKEG